MWISGNLGSINIFGWGSREHGHFWAGEQGAWPFLGWGAGSMDPPIRASRLFWRQDSSFLREWQLSEINGCRLWLYGELPQNSSHFSCSHCDKTMPTTNLLSHWLPRYTQVRSQVDSFLSSIYSQSSMTRHREGPFYLLSHVEIYTRLGVTIARLLVDKTSLSCAGETAKKPAKTRG